MGRRHNSLGLILFDPEEVVSACQRAISILDHLNWEYASNSESADEEDQSVASTMVGLEVRTTRIGIAIQLEQVSVLAFPTRTVQAPTVRVSMTMEPMQCPLY